MVYGKSGSEYFLRLDRGEELLKTLAELCEREHILFATIQGLGAVERADMCVYDAAAKAFHHQVFTGALEIVALTGTVTEMNGAPYLHLHGAVCDAALVAHGGHISSLTVASTCEISLHVLEGRAERKFCPETGLNLLTF